ncbi:membrane-flanked domain protein [Pedosphaera parvula Ellin514]|uniref:Membrane-flanked domain protein n=2 Tax=Pedosphaera TaxID=1032526 RepID=B9XGE7_PEDPL|nr:membrane-flanked domain protein [Pedosphaera parvula Ellin514]
MLKLDGERIILRQRMHRAFFILPLLAGLLLSTPLLLLSLAVERLAGRSHSHLPHSVAWILLALAALPISIFFFMALGSYLRCKIVLTSVQFVYATGLLFRRSGQVELSELQSASLQQSWSGRLLDYGTISINTSKKTLVILPYMSNVGRLLAEIQDAITAFHNRKQHGPLSS